MLYSLEDKQNEEILEIIIDDIKDALRASVERYMKQVDFVKDVVYPAVSDLSYNSNDLLDVNEDTILHLRSISDMELDNAFIVAVSNMAMDVIISEIQSR